MNESNRLLVRDYIIEKAIAWSIGICDHHEIDKINILNASFLAMHKAVENLSEKPDHLIIDGNRFNAYPGISHECFVGGDGIYASIAAASVLAKTFRDEYMLELHQQFPQYGWNTNKAYATAHHRKALVEFGRSPFHRESFQLDFQLEFEF